MTGDKGPDPRFGLSSAVAAFLMWGLLPVFWKQLDMVPSLELVAHRVVWSSVTLLPLLWALGGSGTFGTAIRTPAIVVRQALAAVLVAANWLGFVWAVTHGHMIESSLGYFLTPLVSVLLGVTLLGERLEPLEWLAVAIACSGVGWIAAGYRHLPWIALFLAATFSAYGLVKKTTPLDTLPSLTLETLILLLPALGFLAHEHSAGQGHFATLGRGTDALLALTGPATALPLLCFTHAAKSIPLSTLGLLQYIGPTLQFLVGWLVYGEPFDRPRFVGFAIVWVALGLFAMQRFRRPASANRDLEAEA